MKVVSLNRASARSINIKGKSVTTGLFKEPVAGSIRVSHTGLHQDAVIEGRRGGRADQALSVYAIEHYQHWQSALGSGDFPPGTFGENFTTSGLLETDVRIGDIFRLGSARVQVSHPRLPCRKLNWRMGGAFSKRFLKSRRVGFYLRVLEPGEVKAGDRFSLIDTDHSSPTVDDFVRIAFIDYWDVAGLHALASARDLAPEWQDKIRDKTRRAEAARFWLGSRPLRVVEKITEARGIVSYALRCPYGRSLPAHRGGLMLPITHAEAAGGSAYTAKSFALSGDPAATDYYWLSVRSGTAPTFLGGATVSSFLQRELRVGECVQASAPVGDFTLPRVNTSLVFVTEGLGLAPVRAMLWELVHQSSTAAVALFHSDINSATHPFKHDIEALCTKLGAHLHVAYRGPTGQDVLNRDYHAEGWATPAQHPRYEHWRRTGLFVVSGSLSFVSGHLATLHDDGVRAEQILSQSFGEATQTREAEPSFDIPLPAE